MVGIVGMLRANKLGKDGKVWTDEGFEPMSAAEQDAYIADLSKTTTNWFDELFRTAFSMNHYLSLSGELILQHIMFLLVIRRIMEF